MNITAAVHNMVA